MSKKTEKKVADALLERTIQVKVGAKVYEAPAPTLGTLVMVSELIADLPGIESKEDVAAIFRNVRQGRKIARICAIFIIGAKAVKEMGRRSLLQRLFKPDPVNALANEILLDCNSSDVSRIVAHLVDASNLEDFFELSTFLREVNLTAPTKVEETTASGRS